MTWVKPVNLALVIVLLLLVRKLIWCLRWLWCYYHGKEVPDPIGFLPQRSGAGFDRHVEQAAERKEE